MNSEHTIVVGGSSGVGLAIANLLAAEGSAVTALSRRGLAPDAGTVCGRQVDVRDFPALSAAFEEAHGRRRVRHVIHCAGVGFFAPIGEDHSQAWHDIVSTNVVGVLNVLSVIERVMPDLPHLVYLSSMAAHRVSQVPGNLCYSASKAAAHTIVVEYRRRLREAESRRRVSIVSPGFVENTDFGRNFFRSVAEKDRFDPYANRANLRPADVADVVRYVLRTPEHMEVSDFLVNPVEHAK